MLVIMCHDFVAARGHNFVTSMYLIVWWTPRSKNALERSKQSMRGKTGKSLDSKASAVDTRREFTAVIRLRYTYTILYVSLHEGHVWDELVICKGLHRLGSGSCSFLYVFVACPYFIACFCWQPRDKSTSHLKVEYASPHDAGVKLDKTRTEVLK